MKEIRFAKFLVLLNGAVPVALLAYDAFRGELGANPVNFAIRTTGMLALIFLLLSLAITPLSKSTGYGWLAHFRRSLGLYAFFHAAGHFLLFFVYDRAMNVASTLGELIARPYLAVGASSLLVMIPLAVTSTNAMIKRLGTPRWKKLHKLAYYAAVAAVVHFYMLVKADVRLPLFFAAVLTLLLGYRLAAPFFKAKRKPVTATTTRTAQHSK